VAREERRDEEEEKAKTFFGLEIFHKKRKKKKKERKRMGSDVLIQTQNKSFVPRILDYYERNVLCSTEDRRPFPFFAEPAEDGSDSDLQFRSINSTSSSSPSTSSTSSTSLLHGRLGTSALELSRGCRGGRGAGLVLIENVLASPEEFIEWVRWRSPLPRAVARVYWLGEEEEKEKKREAANESNDENAAAALAAFSASTSSELALKILSRFPKPPPESTPVRIMALPKTLEFSLIDALADEGWPLQTRAGDSEKGLFVVAAALDGLEESAERGRHDPPLPSPRYRAALVRAAAVLADTTEQRRKGSRTCRAEWKLSEALAGLSWAGSGSGEEGGEGRGAGGGDDEKANGENENENGRRRRSETSEIRALDVGASPGGWTRHLALSLKARIVVALDPARLDEDVEALRNVKHLKIRSHTPGALQAVRRALLLSGNESENEEGASTTTTTATSVNLLTCDANEPPSVAATCILPLIPLLCPGGIVVLTLKLRFPGKEKEFATRAALEVLGPAGLELVDSRWLFANTMYERTLVLRKKK